MKIKQVFPRRNLIRPTKMQCKINEYKKPMQVDSHNLYSRWNHSRDLQELHNYEGISKQMNMLECLWKKVSSVKIKAYHLYQTKCDMGLYIIISLAFFYTYEIYIWRFYENDTAIWTCSIITCRIWVIITIYLPLCLDTFAKCA